MLEMSVAIMDIMSGGGGEGRGGEGRGGICFGVSRYLIANFFLLLAITILALIFIPLNSDTCPKGNSRTHHVLRS